jgi:Oxidoreductase molybdopterin binding domain
MVARSDGKRTLDGVRLKDVLDRAGVKAGAVAVRFNGLDEPVVDGAPDFMKSLAIDHARDGEVMLAYGMNGAQMPLLNCFPLRLIVPGWYSNYWVKMLNDVEVLDRPDTNFWMAIAYTIPDTPHASVRPGETGFKSVPISRMVPRSFIINIKAGDTLTLGASTGCASPLVLVHRTINTCDPLLGTTKRVCHWCICLHPCRVRLAARTATPNWNPSGFMLNVSEQTPVVAA